MHTKGPSLPLIKICCIQSIEEAEIAVQFGAGAIGLVSHMPSGPGVIQEQKIREIAEWAPEGVKTFLLTAEVNSSNIIAQYNRCKTTTIQLVDSVDIDIYAALRASLDLVELVQVLHVIGEQTLFEALKVAPYVDALLLDSGNPSLEVKELGGTGRVHDWRISRRIVERVQIPVYLAGGLNPSNVCSAIAQVRPYGLDICSSLRTRDTLDPNKIAQFTEALHACQ